jgi:hypothetical protein
MEHSTVRKLIRAAALSLLAVTTTLGVTSLETMTASPAMSQPDGPGAGSAQKLGLEQPDPTSTPVPTPTPVPPLPVPGG